MILSSIPCSASNSIDKLKHSWLKNQILAVNAGYVSHLFVKASPQRASFEAAISANGEFQSNLNNALRLVRGIIEGLSPAQLVDTGPLKRLSEDLREIVKSALHREYLSQTNIEQLTVPIENALVELSTAFRRFTEVWFRIPSVDQNLIKSEFERLQFCAKALHELLGRLPEGIILP